MNEFELNPTSAQYHLQYVEGTKLFKGGNYPQAFPYLKEGFRLFKAGNYSQAFPYLKVAAFEGHFPEAQDLIGHCYEYGKGDIDPNPDLAFVFYSLAVKQKFAPAQFHLGLCYEQGKLGLNKTATNDKLARRHYNDAASQGFAPAQFHLGLCYEQGKLYEKNNKKAFSHFNSAAVQGHTEAWIHMGLLFTTNPNVDEVLTQYLKSFFTEQIKDELQDNQNCAIFCFEQALVTPEERPQLKYDAQKYLYMTQLKLTNPNKNKEITPKLNNLAPPQGKKRSNEENETIEPSTRSNKKPCLNESALTAQEYPPTIFPDSKIQQAPLFAVLIPPVENVPPQIQRGQLTLFSPPPQTQKNFFLGLSAEPMASFEGYIKKKSNKTLINKGCPEDFYCSYIEQNIQNSAVTFFLNEKSLNFQNWYHSEICHYLLQMTDNKAKCIRVLFQDENEDNNTKTFKNQLLQLVRLSHSLKRPALFVSKEPGSHNHFICGLVKNHNLLFINPLGMPPHKTCYQTLAELKKESIIKEVWISGNPLQKQEYEEKALVSCGPIILELATYFLSTFTPEELDCFWENNLKIRESITYDCWGLICSEISIQDLLPDTLKKLTEATNKSGYQSQVYDLRKKHCEQLQTLPIEHTKNSGTSIEVYLSNCKETAPHQLVFNALITANNDFNNIDEVPEYQLVKQELNLQAGFIYAKPRNF